MCNVNLRLLTVEQGQHHLSLWQPLCGYSFNQEACQTNCDGINYLCVIYVLPHTVLTVMFELWDGIYGAKIDAMVLKQVITAAKRSDNSA